MPVAGSEISTLALAATTEPREIPAQRLALHCPLHDASTTPESAQHYRLLPCFSWQQFMASHLLIPPFHTLKAAILSFTAAGIQLRS